MRAQWATAVPVDPGDRRFEARAPGRRAWEKVIRVSPEGGIVDVQIPPLVEEAPIPVAPAPGAPVVVFLHALGDFDVHHRRPDFSYRGRDRTRVRVEQIRVALDKRARLGDFVVRAQDMEPAERRRAFLAEFGS